MTELRKILQAVRIRNLEKRFTAKSGQVVALSEFSCDIAQGEFAVFLGPSGCGKSTAIRIIAGLETASNGTVLVHGQPVQGPHPTCTMVFQSYTAFPWLSVVENIAFGLRYAEPDLGRKARRSRAAEFARLVGLGDFLDAGINALSGGMKQRVAIAGALATNPELLLMDEPFGALDSQTRMVMQDHLLSVVEQTKKTVVFVTHDIEEALLLGDRIYVCGARPAKIIAEIDVPYPHPRTAAIRARDSFFHMKLEIFNLLRQDFFQQKLEAHYAGRN